MPSGSGKEVIISLICLPAGRQNSNFFMLYASKTDYGKTDSWYIYDTNRDGVDKGGWIENKKWFTEKGIETKTNKWGTRFCFCSIEKLNSIGITDIR